MDALGVVMMGTGAFLVYAAVKGEHPWSMFLGVLGAGSGSSGGSGITPSTTPAGIAPANTFPNAPGSKPIVTPFPGLAFPPAAH